MIKVILADDHHLFLDGLNSILSLEEGIDIVGMAETGKEVLELLKTVPCDVLLLDVSMPDMDGIETAKKVISRHSKTRIIMLTMHDKIVMIEKLIQMGVHGYLLKNVSQSELIMAITKVHSGKEHFSAEIIQKMVDGMRRTETSPFSLTKRELDVMKLIAEGFKSSEIAKKLKLSSNTINAHRKNLLSKAGVKNAIDLINWARENEYVV